MNEFTILKELDVLYVDDDKDACESLAHILKYYFKTVCIAFNGEEAYKKYKNNNFHLLIVDYDMPIMNGYEFLKKVREEDSETAAFIVSSYDDKTKLKSAIPLKLLDYLVKPYELEDLKNILRGFIKSLETNSLLKFYFKDDCYYDFSRKAIFNKGIEDSFTSYEARLFEFLLKNKNKIITYDILLDIIDSTNHRSLISIMYKIKKKIPNKLIENIKDIGYILKK